MSDALYLADVLAYEYQEPGKQVCAAAAAELRRLVDERRFYRDALKAALDALKNSRPLPRDGDDDYAETGFRRHIFATNRVHAALYGKGEQSE